MRLKTTKILPGVQAIALAVGVGLAVYAQEPTKDPDRPTPQEEFHYQMGFIPTEETLPHLGRKPRPDLAQAADLPARWDWREFGGVTRVKDQGGCGSCYAFAAIANIESALAIRGEGTFDLSENNVKECPYGDPSCGGGGYNIIASYLATKGTVLDMYDQYVPLDVECDDDGPYQHTLLDWRLISHGNRTDPLVLKQYIYEYGPVQSSIYAGWPIGDPEWYGEMSSYDGSYTLFLLDTGNVGAPNHAVLIIGWDDSLLHAGGMGGWIVKNSWGTEWGGPCGYGIQGGFFTIAYGSAEIGSHSSFIQDWKEFDPEERLLYYDEAYPLAGYGFDDVTAWGMCAFEQPNISYLTRVEFWTIDITTDIDIYIYDDFDGIGLSNLLTSKLDVAYTEAGYHSVALDSVVEIAAGNDFFVAVKFTNESYLSVVRWDWQGPVESGKTFVSPTGEPGTWIDMAGGGTGYAPGDVAIRVRTIVGETPPEPEPIPYAFNLSNAYPNPFNGNTNIAYSLEGAGHVELTIYNLLGQKVRTLVNGERLEGAYTAVWNGTDSEGKPVASGVYLYQIKSGDFVETRKLVLLK